MGFPFGKAPLAIVVVAIASSAAWIALRAAGAADSRRPDLIFATFVKEHADAYRPAIAEFERRHGVKIQVQVVSQRALQNRLQSAIQVNADVPDMVELLNGTLGYFTRGPIEDVGFVDLTQRVRGSGLYDQLVTSRFPMWSSRGRIFALPHDVHPVMLVYRRDLVEQLGLDVNRLTTWDEFARAGQEVTKDLTGDGVPDRYMLDLQADGSDNLKLLMLQAGATVFDERGDVAFDSERAADVVCWYVKAIQGAERIAFPCGWGQNLSKAMIDGLCLFYVCPDWRTMQIQADIPSLRGKLAVMPMPAWTPGGRRTSTWGGTGLAFTKKCRDFELAWKLAMYLYYDADQLAPRFAATNILPPLKSAWARPEFDEPRPFFSGQRLGREYVALADDVPQEPSHAYMTMATGKLSEAYANAVLYHREHGDAGLREYTRAELARCADIVRRTIARNAFLARDTTNERAGGVEP